MRLQSDPVVFSLTGGKNTLNRDLTKADLKIKSPSILIKSMVFLTQFVIQANLQFMQLQTN